MYFHVSLSSNSILAGVDVYLQIAHKARKESSTVVDSLYTLCINTGVFPLQLIAALRNGDHISHWEKSKKDKRNLHAGIIVKTRRTGLDNY